MEQYPMDTEAAKRKGMTAAPDELRTTLSTASSAYIEGALLNPALSDEDILFILKNPSLTAPLIEKICREQRWMKHYEIKAAVVQHPRTSRYTALKLVKFLFWKDLLAVSLNARLSPPLKRNAEELLKDRVEEMALGEQISLARTAGRSVIKRLLESRNPKIIEAILQNCRTSEEEVVTIARSKTTPPPVLSVVARNYKWSSRYHVKMAILTNKKTPVHDSLKSLNGLTRKDLRTVRENPKVREIVRVAASRILESRK